MSTLAVAASITRDAAHGGPGALDIGDDVSYRIVDVGAGAKSWQRQTATSPWTHGRSLIAATLDIEVATLVVRVLGSTSSQLDSNLAALLLAVHQYSYTLSVTIQGVNWSWLCEPADYTVDVETFNKFFLLAKQRLVTMQIPRSPIPIAGSV